MDEIGGSKKTKRGEKEDKRKEKKKEGCKL